MPPDYDTDPERWKSWQPQRDVHEIVANELSGPTLDIGCGNGRLASLLSHDVSWVGLDSSRTQLAANPRRPVVLADMRQLPFRDGVFAEVTHLWCLYHNADPLDAIREAWRVLRPGGRYSACTAARTNDPELMWDGYPPTPFERKRPKPSCPPSSRALSHCRGTTSISRCKRARRSGRTVVITPYRPSGPKRLKCRYGSPNAACWSVQRKPDRAYRAARAVHCPFVAMGGRRWLHGSACSRRAARRRSRSSRP